MYGEEPMYEDEEPMNYTDEYGEPMYPDEYGELRYADEFEEEEPMYFENEYGDIVDANGTVVRMAEDAPGAAPEEQQQLYEDEYGNIVDEYGNVLDYGQYYDEDYPEEYDQYEQGDYDQYGDYYDQYAEEPEYDPRGDYEYDPRQEYEYDPRQNYGDFSQYEPGYYETEEGYVFIDEYGNLWDEEEVERARYEQEMEAYEEEEMARYENEKAQYERFNAQNDGSGEYPYYFENPNEYEGFYQEDEEPQYDYFEEEPYEGYEAFMADTYAQQRKRPLMKGSGKRRTGKLVRRPKKGTKGRKSRPTKSMRAKSTKNFTNWRMQSRLLRTQIRQAKTHSPRKPKGQKAPHHFPAFVPILVPKKKRPVRFNPIKKKNMKPVQKGPKTPWRKASRHLRVQIEQARKLSPRPTDKEAKENLTFPDVEVYAPPGRTPTKKAKQVRRSSSASRGGGRPRPINTGTGTPEPVTPGSGKKKQRKYKKVALKKVPYKTKKDSESKAE